MLKKATSRLAHIRMSSSQSISSTLRPVFIVGAARTPVGSFQGVFAKVSAVQLGIAAVNGAMHNAGVKPDMVEDLYFGNVLQAGVGQSPARQVVLGTGMPEATEATTINKVPRFPFLSLTRFVNCFFFFYCGQKGLRFGNESCYARDTEYSNW
jgi:hypothetical protein